MPSIRNLVSLSLSGQPNLDASFIFESTDCSGTAYGDYDADDPGLANGMYFAGKNLSTGAITWYRAILSTIHATQLLKAGTPLHIVAHRLGHRDPMVTAKTYAHIDADQAINVSLVFAKAVE